MGLKSGTVAPKDLRRLNVDTTVQTKAVAFPTDTRLLHKARMALVRLAVKHGITLRQSYARVGKAAEPGQALRPRSAVPPHAARDQRLRTWLGRVILVISSVRPDVSNRRINVNQCTALNASGQGLITHSG